MNLQSLLAFESPNKTDFLIIQATKKIPYHAQSYIRERLKGEEPSDLATFIRNAFGNPALDKRDPLFRSAKEYYTRMKGGREWHNFTDEEITEIVRLSQTRKPRDIIEAISPDLKDKNEMNKRSAAVKALQDAIGLEYLGPATIMAEILEVEGEGEYRAPQNDETIIRKINKSVVNTDWAKHSLDSFKKRCVKSLKGYMGIQLFVLQVNSYRSSIERQVFEGEFIKLCYDKPDMIPDDVNACMMLAGEYVRQIQIRDMINLFDTKMKAAFDGDDKSGLTQSFAENLKAKTAELEKCQKNIKDLQVRLNDSRNKRKEAEAKYNDSIARYVNAACSESQRRALLVKKKAYEQNVLQPEIDRLIETEDGEVHGISVDEILGFDNQINDE